MTGHPTWWTSPNCPDMPTTAKVGNEWTCPLCGTKWRCFRRSLPRRDQRNGSQLSARRPSWLKVLVEETDEG